MHQRDALTKRGVEHGLALFDLHLDADRLETNRVNYRVRMISLRVKDISHRNRPAGGGLEAETGAAAAPDRPVWSSDRD